MMPSFPHVYDCLSSVSCPSLVYVRKGRNGEAEIVLLDHGLYEYIDTKERVALANMYKSIVLRDEEAMQHYSQLMNVEGRLYAH